MPQKILKKGDGVWGSGKKTFSKVFFPPPQSQKTLYQEQSANTLKNSGE